MEKINFQNGTLISKAKVTIDNTVYDVEPAEYEGTTPLSAEILNQMQDNIEKAIEEKQANIDALNKNINSRNTYSTTEEIETGETWIDGKKIYRKSFTFAVDSSTHKTELDVSELNIAAGMFDVNNSYIHDATNGRYTPLIISNVSTTAEQQDYSSQQAGVYFKDGFNSFVVECGYSITAGAFVTIRYTKNTD